MPPTLDILTTVADRMSRYKIPASLVASLADISGGRLSTFLNGQTSLPNDLALRLNQVTNSLVQLVESARPLPLDFKRANTLREVLSRIQSGELQVIIRQS
jgi:hypothetical protein